MRLRPVLLSDRARYTCELNPPDPAVAITADSEASRSDSDTLISTGYLICRVVSQLVVQQYNCGIHRLSDCDNVTNAPVPEILL
jgi:hypothetical protein